MADDRNSELEARVRQLEAENEDLRGFARAAAHDLQEPVNKLITFAGLLRRSCTGNGLSNQAHRFLDVIEHTASRMKTVVADQLALARLGEHPVRLEELAVDDCIDEALERLAHRIQELAPKITRAPMPRARADRALLTRVYQNLIGNALKFAGGDRPQIELTIQKGPSGSILGVRDRGIGIDPAFSRVIFEPLRRLHPRGSYEGNGIGLALCRKAIELQGGRIWAESDGPGTGLHIRLVLSTEGG